MSHRRPKLVHTLAQVILTEFKCQRNSRSNIGDKFESFKTKLRAKLDEYELQDLAALAASAIVEANHLCKVSSIKTPGSYQHPKFRGPM